MTSPVRYQADVEKVEPDEAETIRGLEEQFKIILDTTSKDYGHGVRSVHAKGHGIARGTLTVHDGLSPEFAQGLFAAPGQYEAIFRLSTNAGDILDDSIDLPRGLALKILGIEGERLPGSEGDATQDFVMVNGPTFAAPTPKAFLANLKMLAKTTDKAEGGKKLLSGLFRAAEAALEAVGGQSAFLTTLGGAKPVHPLGATYYSQTPFRYGDYVAKFSLVPASAVLKDFADATIDAAGRPDAIRENVREGLIGEGGTWEFRVQLCADLEKMPIEDPTVLWDEKASPFVTVATLDVSPQVAWQDGVSQKIEDELAFSPWHGLTAHQPLGGVNRARKSPYDFSADYRGRVNGCPIHEPSRLAELAG
ncbi:catalase family protein [Sphingomonas sp. CGMCC 1.13654]|uniref:Catalase family protein n=1 Tax=Sphingomonas chungangi TaxID=2683589 RepID=A0A838LCK5_9SPHN|nr:catalase family protein [Sphingomonas chungangi]MBA2935218.1 catalase family protein [Sphingomonas chungangi]MVW55296.1 catalase [Sphingomonas chungangi]